MMPDIQNLKEREHYQIWRKRNRVRLIDVSIYCECSESLISRWENGKVNIDDSVLKKYNDFITHFENTTDTLLNTSYNINRKLKRGRKSVGDCNNAR